MKVTKATAIADLVLPLVMKRLRSLKMKGEAVVGPYVNGRERGYSVALYVAGQHTVVTPCVAFSENRNSDSLVVYPCNAMYVTDDETRAHHDRGLSEHAWKRAVYYDVRYGENGGAAREKAADFIVANLRAQAAAQTRCSCR